MNYDLKVTFDDVSVDNKIHNVYKPDTLLRSASLSLIGAKLNISKMEAFHNANCPVSTELSARK